MTDQAEATIVPAVKAATAYDCVTRSVRRSIWLVHPLGAPVKTVDRTAARKQIIRTVEDTIQRHAGENSAAILHEELLDRLDTPDLEDEIDGRPIDAIITDIIRDLGLALVPGHRPWKRRTPEDIAVLSSRRAASPKCWANDFQRFGATLTRTQCPTAAVCHSAPPRG